MNHYDPEVLAAVRRAYANKELRARTEADRRAAEVREAIPALIPVDAALAATASKIMAEIRRGKEDLPARVERVRQENAALQAKKAALLEANGYPADYTRPHYECPLCEDRGYLDGGICACMKAALAKESVARSGIGQLLESETFENFSLDYYEDKLNAAKNLRSCKDFAATLHGNLLLMGGTGLGKTHLSSAIVGRVLESGRFAVYTTVGDLISDYEYERFHRGRDESADERTAKYARCDLLVIDDLGTEVCNQFTVGVLYSVINDRLNRRLATVISTNLTINEIKERYVDRVASRLLGEYEILPFVGRDIRMLKRFAGS